MTKKLLRTKGDRWCELEVSLKDGRLRICGSEGRILKFGPAKREAREYWESYFQDDPSALGDMAVRFGTRTAKSAARKVLEVDGAFHGLDIHKSRTNDVLVTESCGQIRETLAEWFPEVVPYMSYHLNNIHAGTPAQEAELAKYKWDGHGSHFEWACMKLSEAGLLVDREYREANRYFPNGYKYGSAWLQQALPAAVTKWFNGLADTLGVS
jgi:hypothetical protein